MLQDCNDQKIKTETSTLNYKVTVLCSGYKRTQATVSNGDETMLEVGYQPDSRKVEYFEVRWQRKGPSPPTKRACVEKDSTSPQTG